jgi:hypothetical protein
LYWPACTKRNCVPESVSRTKNLIDLCADPNAHAITAAVSKINGKTADSVLADLPPGPSAPKNRGPGANAMSLDDANGHDKAPKPRPKPGSGINEKITVHGARTENGTPFDYPGIYAQRFDGANRAPAAPQTSVSKVRTTPLWGVRYGR